MFSFIRDYISYECFFLCLFLDAGVSAKCPAPACVCVRVCVWVCVSAVRCGCGWLGVCVFVCQQLGVGVGANRFAFYRRRNEAYAHIF